jgi:hypothetical protein
MRFASEALLFALAICAALLLLLNAPITTGRGVAPQAAAGLIHGRPPGVVNIQPLTATLTPTVWLPAVMNNGCPPVIEFTHVPPYGSFDDLQGRTACVAPANYRVAVYIFVAGWYNKPHWSAPLTPIRSDGTWTCDITTGGTDQLATRIAAFLVPAGYNPPRADNSPELFDELYANTAAYVIQDRPAVYRTLEFAGRLWKVKASATPAGPGPNYFSDSADDVWVDAQGRLHLKIVYRNGRWYSTEVFGAEPLGYGTYTFTLASRVDQLDQNIVLGLFTWDDTDPGYAHREIDIEFARWGDAAGPNSQYVVSPWDHSGNRYQFNTTLSDNTSTHSFEWRSSGVQFASYQGHAPNLGGMINTWLYTGPDVPPAGLGNARINLWLLNGAPPSDGQGAEVIIERFEFVP